MLPETRGTATTGHSTAVLQGASPAPVDDAPGTAPLAALRAALRILADGGALSEAIVTDAFGAVMSGEATPSQIGALLLGLRARGETPAELAGVARALRRAMVTLPADHVEQLVDTCGTGGGTVPTFNISTVAAFVAAGAGVRVAKHGNRSYTSRCGSADVLEALGVPLNAPVPVLARVLAEAGIVFMFAPLMHPAMRHVAVVRRELGVPTLMNVVGPLANPAGARRQVIGVADRKRLALVATALRTLGSSHVLVVYGEPGLDEISPIGLTHVIEVQAGEERRWTIDPHALGLGAPTSDDLQCGPPATNARLLEDLLGGAGPRGARSAVVLNAAAAIYVSGRVGTFKGAVDAAADSLDRGAGLAALERMLAAYGAEPRL